MSNDQFYIIIGEAVGGRIGKVFRCSNHHNEPHLNQQKPSGGVLQRRRRPHNTPGPKLMTRIQSNATQSLVAQPKIKVKKAIEERFNMKNRCEEKRVGGAGTKLN